MHTFKHCFKLDRIAYLSSLIAKWPAIAWLKYSNATHETFVYKLNNIVTIYLMPKLFCIPNGTKS